MTMQEVVDYILTYIEHNSKNKNKNKNKNSETKETRGETFSYGASPEALARWAEEDGG